MKVRELAVVLAVALLLTAVMVNGERVRTAAAAQPQPVRTLTELDERAERRHQELLIKIESLRRQAVALLGRKGGLNGR